MKKTVVITGSSRGIGKAIAIKFVSNNYNVVINYSRSGDPANQTVANLKKENLSAIAVKADVSNFDEAGHLIDAAISEFGSIDVLINNCGISEQKLFDKITEEDWDKMMSVNVKSVFNCCRHAVPYMLKKHSGNIINISSIWGITGASCEVPYSASKAAVIGFTKALAKELGPSGIRVNCIAPGAILTDMLNDFNSEEINSIRQETPLGNIGSAEDIANSAYFLASDEAKFITGQVISPNGGLVI